MVENEKRYGSYEEMSLIAELRRPEGPPSRAPYSYGKEKKSMNEFSHGFHG